MRRTTKSVFPVLLHDKFKLTKVKTKITNGSPVPVYKGLEAIECLRFKSPPINLYLVRKSRLICMLDQTFSSKNFMTIYEKENRMGNIPKESMSLSFQNVVEKIQKTNKRLHELRHKKKQDRTDDDVLENTQLKQELRNLREKKQECLQSYTESLANNVNGPNFRFRLIKVKLGSKVGFKIDRNDHPQLFAMKQLQCNLQKTFKVKQANRHLIMANIKLLLKTKRPYYIIRTDVSSFFESISQEILLHSIMDNTLLSYKSKVFIKAILSQYEEEKKKLTVEESVGMKEGYGVPRGIGISSLLAEIYMRNFDNTLRKRPEVIFYVRYVDDTFMLLAQLPHDKTIEGYYNDLENEFKKFDLSLKQLIDEKCFVYDSEKQKTKPQEVTYLGYKLSYKNISKGADKSEHTISFHLSSDKYKRITQRIDNAFKHFDLTNKYNLHQARKDLVDSLKLIMGNVKLHKSKSGIKTGLYFNSDLLDEDVDDLNQLNTYLYGKKVNLYEKLFSNSEDKNKYEAALYDRIKKFDFEGFWKTRKMYSLSGKRLKEIMRWLNYEEKEDQATI